MCEILDKRSKIRYNLIIRYSSYGNKKFHSHDFFFLFYHFDKNRARPLQFILANVRQFTQAKKKIM